MVRDENLRSENGHNMEPVNVRTCSAHVTFRARSSHGRPREFFHTCCMRWSQPSTIFFLSFFFTTKYNFSFIYTIYTLMSKAEPCSVFTVFAGEQISPRKTFPCTDKHLHEYYTARVRHRQSVLLQVLAVSNFSTTRREGNRADRSFPFPRCFNPKVAY